MALSAEVGDASANSYVTLAEANSYFETRPDGAAWEALGDDREMWLIAATDRLEQFVYEGVRTDELQALSFPRWGVVVDGILLDDNVIPDRIKRAQMKLALILGENSTFLQDTGLEGFENVKLGPLDVTPRHAREAGELPQDVYREIRPLLDGATTSPFQFRIYRGG